MTNTMAVIGVEREAPLETLTHTLRDAAWELAVEVVDEGLLDGSVPSLADLDPLSRLGEMPSFIAELAREIADPQPSRLLPEGPLLSLAREHARRREELGFEPREVLTEFLVLRRVLWRALSRERDLLDAVDPLVIEHRLDSAFDRLVIECAVAFFDRATEELAERARCDPLTGLLNHQAFWKEVRGELERAHRYAHGVAFVFIDIDWFKLINDTYGHPLGDRVLRGVADVLRGDLRESDLVGRTGGDEFAVCLVESEPHAGRVFVERLRQRIAAFAADGDVPAGLTVSAGCAHFPTEAASAEALFELADSRLYDAKRSRTL